MNRRNLIKGALASSAALAGGRGLQALADEDFPLGDLEAHVRMRGTLDGERTYWYYKGTVFGNRWGEVTRPMLGVEGVSYSTMEALPGGRYRYRLNEAGYYSDPESGAIGEPVINPFTGERYTPKNYLSPQSIIFHPDLTVTPDVERLPPGLEYRGRIAPLRVFKDTVISSEDLFVRTVVPEARRQPDELGFKVQTSLATLTASRRELLDPAVDFVPCQLNYQTLATFREWMNMGTQPGMMSWRMVGTKCREDDLPPAITSRIRAEHPGFFG
jgi:hypothetical protein